ncbi:MAG TPA: bifunctional phosphoribosyl-AMP cyclohydrolase/phosphoribosyl-ATP diphosphatase HisIE [Chitinophagaceae bacterium]|nr:bifunctional phosphoribosyl-AMP cyclohydrolase/phosphoribosyl-ATP diphosphatase HisIE [Chitinophagaceae bacterium]
MIIDYNKYSDGLVPAIIQDYKTNMVLMLGFMNEEAVEQTKQSGKVTFFSRNKKRLWTKGEVSGHFLTLIEMKVDCDNDTLLIKADPAGPVCHTGSDTCFDESNQGQPDNFLSYLEDVIKNRRQAAPGESYVARMMSKGINKIAQKVGEEAVELIIEAKDDNKDLFLGEAADLLFHYLMLLNVKGYSLNEVIEVLKSRHK